MTLAAPLPFRDTPCEACRFPAFVRARRRLCDACRFERAGGDPPRLAQAARGHWHDTGHHDLRIEGAGVLVCRVCDAILWGRIADVRAAGLCTVPEARRLSRVRALHRRDALRRAVAELAALYRAEADLADVLAELAGENPNPEETAR